ncbi:MAG: bifunctional methionine sulfoxide reductase B/A protein [Thermoguttaceae bacterium]|nr:bifunctional methionine sulfoxide reductase B/A protein [Thermoguttaceae bacterium]
MTRRARTAVFLVLVLFLEGYALNLFAKESQSPYGPLNDEEKRVIDESGTEQAFTGKYTDLNLMGVYACRKCGAPLYRSDDKFPSRCGWPAFDNELPSAVKRSLDPDGRRTEITCARCGAHLGHVFLGEQLTSRDTRHCVNSICMVFESQDSKRLQRAVFAGGCFWGVEERMKNLPGVVCATSGFTGGRKANPTYKEVCTGRTGHAEAVEIIFDPTKTDYETLCMYFLEIHDPTEKNRQGPDVGTQYRSGIFYLDEAQKKTARKLLKILREKGYNVQTEVEPFRHFWQAERYHQNYYERTGKTPYCHTYQKRF